MIDLGDMLMFCRKPLSFGPRTKWETHGHVVQDLVEDLVHQILLRHMKEPTEPVLFQLMRSSAQRMEIFREATYDALMHDFTGGA